MPRITNQRNKGFTLAELLIVIAIIAVLVAIAIPTMAGMTERARSATCSANRRSLLGEVSVSALTERLDVADVFGERYPQVKDICTCPDGGTYSYDAYQKRIVCNKHADPGVSVGGGANTFRILPDGGVITEEKAQYKKGDKVNIVKGKVYLANGECYVVQNDYTNLTMNKDTYAEWLEGLYSGGNVKKVDFSKQYEQSDLGSGNTITDYSNLYNTGRSSVGSVYNYDGKLYVQIAGIKRGISGNPTESTEYWAPLGTIVE